jgi:PTS system nitrogen regulatory IIA component
VQLKLEEVATLFSVEERVVYRWVREENLPTHVVNQQYRFSRAELIEWATLHRMAIPPALLRLEDREFPESALAQALERGGVHAPIFGADKFALLKTIVQKIPHVRESEREQLFALLQARESRGSTAIGDGIAIPHPAHPIALASGAAVISLFYLAPPVDLGAEDGKPVHALFVLVTPNVRYHTILLAQLSSALRDTKFRDAVQGRAPAARILELARRSCGKTQT